MLRKRAGVEFAVAGEKTVYSPSGMEVGIFGHKANAGWVPCLLVS